MPSPQKSTIVRFQHLTRRALFRAADLFMPRLAGRIARDIWFAVPPALAAARLPDGATAFEVESLGAAVRGHVWGADDAPVVYLVHGWGGRGSQLAPFVEPLLADGFRVVMFDAPAHGDSDAGPAGPGRSHGVEFGKALDAVFARFGPAEAVLAHSLGTISTYLTLRFGWLSTRRLVLLAPMVVAEPLFDQFQRALGFGARTRRAFDRHLDEFVGIPMAEFDAVFQASHVEPVPTLVVHDRGDRQTPYADSVRLVESLPDARLVTTDGLGHRRILKDPAVVGEVTTFLRDVLHEADARRGAA
jgi:pimeloyl-ACP methyl ester carboxylesterase